MTNEQVSKHKCESDQEHDDLAHIAVMHEVDKGVLGLALFLIRDPSEGQNLHVEKSSCDAHSEHMDLHERLLEHVCKEIPILLSEWTSSQTILEAGATDKVQLHDHGYCDEDVSDPLALLVDYHEEGQEE